MSAGFRLMNRNRASTVAACVALALGTLQPQIASADLTRTSEFNIAPQPLRDALLQYSRQSGVQVTSADAIIQPKNSFGVSGELDARKALEILLKGTELSYEVIGENTVTIRSVPQRNGAFSTTATSTGTTASSIRLVRAEEQASAATGAASEAASAPRNEPSTSGVEASSPVVLQEVIVTGSHIRGGKQQSAPTQVITRSDIEKTGYTSVEGLIDDLPQNFASVSTDASLSNQSGRMTMGNAIARGAAVDLRGLGAESTLTLLNGRRIAAGTGAGRAVDVSIIPLSVIDRIEVVSGGQSAIYGADAVAGVVNFVTRRQFDGFETQVSYGFSPEHGEAQRWQLSQLAGYSGERLGFVAAYDYSRTNAFDLRETRLLLEEVGTTKFLLKQATPKQNVHSLFLSGHYSLTDAIEIGADAFYARKRSLVGTAEWYQDAARPSFWSVDFENAEYGATLGALIDVGAGWSLNVAGTTSKADTNDASAFDLSYPGFDYVGASRSDQAVATDSFSVVADGTLPQVLGLIPRLAVGAEYRGDEIDSRGVGYISLLDRNVKSVFSELLLPIVTEGAPGLRSLEVSIAARYDDYSDLGSTFNPQGGIVWRVFDAFKVRASYTEAFRAPGLLDAVPSGFHSVDWRNDPIAGGQSPVLLLLGSKPDLGPETATSRSIGFDFEPQLARHTRIWGSYFQIDYRNRLERPIIATVDLERMLENANYYPAQLLRNPSTADLAAALSSDTDGVLTNTTGVALNPDGSDLLSVFPSLVVFDNRIANVAVEKFSGLDFGTSVEWEGGQSIWSIGMNATYTLRHDRYLTPTSPGMDAIDGVGKPVRFRTRANLGWNRGAWDAYLYVNYWDGYANEMPGATMDVSSWTTLNASLRFDGSSISNNGIWSGLSATLSADNVLDKAPPYISGQTGDGLLYDPMNASALGRFITMRVTKRW